MWLDHSQARIIAFSRDNADKANKAGKADKAVIIHAPNRREHQHHKADAVGSGRASEHPEYCNAIVEKIRSVKEWLVVGPANAKLAFVKHIHKAHHDLNDHLIGVETVDHPTDGQLLAYARKYFVTADRMLG